MICKSGGMLNLSGTEGMYILKYSFQEHHSRPYELLFSVMQRYDYENIAVIENPPNSRITIGWHLI